MFKSGEISSLSCTWSKLAGVRLVTESLRFSLDTECAISYHYLLPRPVVVCIFAFVPEEHGRK